MNSMWLWLRLHFSVQRRRYANKIIKQILILFYVETMNFHLSYYIYRTILVYRKPSLNYKAPVAVPLKKEKQINSRKSFRGKNILRE